MVIVVDSISFQLPITQLLRLQHQRPHPNQTNHHVPLKKPLPIELNRAPVEQPSPGNRPSPLRELIQSPDRQIFSYHQFFLTLFIFTYFRIIYIFFKLNIHSLMYKCTLNTLLLIYLFKISLHICNYIYYSCTIYYISIVLKFLLFIAIMRGDTCT